MAGLGRLVSGLGLALLLALGAPREADAQKAASAVTPLPPTFQAIDANGVDLMSGRLAISNVQASVGPPGEGGLTQAFSTLSVGDNLTGGIYAPQNTGTPITVTVGDNSIQFLPAVGGGFTPDAGASGQILTLNSTTGVYTLTSKDGTVSVFSPTSSTAADGQAALGRISTVTRPNGEVLTYTYRTDTPFCLSACSLLAVTSNLGYMIKYEYVNTGTALIISRIRAINLAYEYCDPNAAACNPSGAWNGTTFSGNPIDNWVATDSLGNSTTYVATLGLNQSFQIQRPNGVTTTVTYAAINGAGSQPLVATVSNGVNTWNYGFGLNNYNQLAVATVTDPLGHQRTLTFAAYAGTGAAETETITDTDALGNTTTYVKNFQTGLITKVTRPEGDYTTYEYDSRGNVKVMTQYPKPGSSLPALTTTAVYPTTCTNTKTCNKPLSVTEQGATTDYTYDPNHGGVLTITSPAGSTGVSDGVRPQSRYFYVAKSAAILNSSGVLVAGPAIQKLNYINQCQTLASCTLGAEEYRLVDDYPGTTAPNNIQRSGSRIYTQGGAVQSTTAYTYTPAGDLATVDGPLTSPIIDVSQRRYDAKRQLVGDIGIDPDGYGSGRPAVATRYAYRGDGQLDWKETGTVVSQSDADWAAFTPAERVVFAYDTAGRRIRETLMVGGTAQAVSQTSYDAAGRTECVAIRMNAAAFGSLPASACVQGTAGAYGPDRIERYAYDNANRRTSVTRAYGSADQIVDEVSTYTLNGKVQTIADANGNLTTYQYDGFDRLAKTRFPSAADGKVSSNADYTEQTYDTVTGRMNQDRRRDGTLVNYTYDGRGNLLSRSAPAAAYTYDNLDAMRTATENGQTLTMAYDNLHRMTSVTGPLGTVSYFYDLAFQRYRLQWPDVYYVNYTRDWAGAVTQISQQWNYDPLIDFQYDSLGRRIGITRKNGVTTTYTYDPVSRLATLTNDLSASNSPDKDQTLTFGYNPASQLTSRTSSNGVYAFANLYNLTRQSPANGLNQYTAFGPQTVTHDPRGNMTSDGVATYTYDIANRLTGASNGAALSYDGLGRLYEVSSSGTAATRFQYDGANLITEYNTSGTVLRRYVFGPGEDEPLVWIDGSTAQQNIANRNYLIADHQGSIVAITNGSGVATYVNTYDEYGVPGSGNFGRFQYTGQAWIAEANIYHYKARAYAPVLGRFLQTDPSGYDDGLNLYAYVKGDPINSADPDGRESATVALGLTPSGFRYGTPEGDADQSRIATGFQDGISMGLMAGPLFEVGLALKGGLALTAARLEASKLTRSKIINYLLNPTHLDGGPKAAWFERAMGITQKNAGALIKQVKFDAKKAILQEVTKYGTKFSQVTEVTGANGSKGVMTTIWQVDKSGKAAGQARLVTAKDFKVIEK